MKLCPGCGERKPRDAFFEEPNDDVTGLSHLCRVCMDKKRARGRVTDVSGWTVRSPSGIEGVVIRIREEEDEIVVRFAGTRTVVLPLVR